MSIDVGLDLVRVEDVAESLQGDHARRYLDRIYTETEVADCRVAGAIDPTRLAGRFAAKEATLKVISSGEDGIPMDDIEVRREASGRVHIELHGRAAEVAAAAGVQELALSITHEAGFAAAVVIATRGAAT
jgi:holo-[acyl-carrier protein] synthase